VCHDHALKVPRSDLGQRDWDARVAKALWDTLLRVCPWLQEYMRELLLTEGREQCLDGRVPANLISCGLNMPHAGLHRDLKDAPLNIIAWTSISGGRGEEKTEMIGGQFVLPSLGVLFTPGATADVTVVLIASAVLTHGTLPLSVTVWQGPAALRGAGRPRGGIGPFHHSTISPIPPTHSTGTSLKGGIAGRILCDVRAM
jgi:hypothetical protein